MTRTSRLGTQTVVLLVSMLVGTLAAVLMDGRTGFSTASASIAQNANKSGGQTAAKNGATKPKANCSKADDAALAAEIRERLSKSAVLKDEKEIIVDVKARVATLTGTVKVKKHRQTAAAEAKKVACIKRVDVLICGKCVAPQVCCPRTGACQDPPCPGPRTPK